MFLVFKLLLFVMSREFWNFDVTHCSVLNIFFCKRVKSLLFWTCFPSLREGLVDVFGCLPLLGRLNLYSCLFLSPGQIPCSVTLFVPLLSFFNRIVHELTIKRITRGRRRNLTRAIHKTIHSTAQMLEPYHSNLLTFF